MSKKKTLAKVEQALSQDTLWRAKEILQGNIANGYDLDIYEKYGQVLLKMGDSLEAGKYLFLCGRAKPSYEEPIKLYLKRFSKTDARALVGTFPKAAQLFKIADYPQSIQQYLSDAGYTPKSLKDSLVDTPSSVSTKIMATTVALLLLGLLIIIGIGCISALLHGCEIIVDWYDKL